MLECPAKGNGAGEGLEYKSDVEQQKELGLFSSEKRRPYYSLKVFKKKWGLVSSTKSQQQHKRKWSQVVSGEI